MTYTRDQMKEAALWAFQLEGNTNSHLAAKVLGGEPKDYPWGTEGYTKAKNAMYHALYGGVPAEPWRLHAMALASVQFTAHTTFVALEEWLKRLDKQSVCADTDALDPSVIADALTWVDDEIANAEDNAGERQVRTWQRIRALISNLG